MDELFDIYSKNYRVEWKVNNECFYLYFNDDKLRLVVCDDLLFLDKYNNIF